MRLKYQMETMELEDHVIAVPAGKGTKDFHGIIKLNEMGAEILKLLEQDTTEEAMAGQLETEYEVSREVLLSDIHHFLMELEERGMLIK